MIDQSALALAQSLDALSVVHAELITLSVAQRDPIARGDVDAVTRIAGEIEIHIARAQAAEEARHRAAGALADAVGSAATRWSVLATRLPDDARDLIAPRIARLESQVRELELANAINAGLCAQELQLVDHALRTVLAPGEAPGSYTSRGGDAPTPPAAPVLINTTA